MQQPIVRIIFVSLSILLLVSAGYAQVNLLETRVSIKAKNQAIIEVLDQIHEEFSIDFTYSNNIFPDNTTVTIKAKKETIQSVLEKMLDGFDLEFLVVENQIVIRSISGDNTVKGQRKYTISGYIQDSENGESLFGTSVYIKELSTGTTTNAYGFYSITLPRGNYELTFSFLGYVNKSVEIDLDRNISFSDKLEMDKQSLKEVVIEANENLQVLDNSQLSEIRLTPKSIQHIPSFMGETEVIKSLQNVPGIKTYGDGSTYYYVRGGNRDQNMVLIDEAPVYNPSHLMGFFSSFIPNAIKSVNIYKGDFPIEYGGRLSSIMDIRTKEGNLYKFEGDISLGAFISRLSFNGPFVKEKSSYFISLRRSNLNWLFRETDQDISFNDLNFKLNFRLGKRDRLYYSGYLGTDKLNQFNSGVGTFGMQWTNFTNTLRWNHIFNDKLFSNTTFYTSTYDYRLIINEQDSSYWYANISTFSLKTDFTYYFNPALTLKYGYQFAFYGITPGELSLGEDFDPVELGYPSVFNKSSLRILFYSGIEHRISEKLSMKYGLRYNAWKNMGPATEYEINTNFFPIDTTEYTEGEVYNTFNNLEPRISLNYLIDRKSSIKASYNRTCQHLQILSNSISPFTSLEIWYPSGPNIQPQIANQYTLGYFRKIRRFASDFSVELFYKKMKNQLDYVDHADMLINPVIETEIRFGEAWAYGVELLLSKQMGKMVGSVSYTWSRAFRQTEFINDNKVYPAFYDRPHDASISISYNLSKRFVVAGNWVYSTGSAISVPTSFYYYQNYPVPIYEDKNNGRLPDYHRLDLMLRMDLNPHAKGNFKHHLVFTLYNAYWRKNFYNMNYNKIQLGDDQIIIPVNHQQKYNFIPTSRYMLGAIPAISYNISF